MDNLSPEEGIVKQSYKTILLWLLLIVIFVSLYHFFKSSPEGDYKRLGYSRLVQIIETKPTTIVWAEFADNYLEGRLSNGIRFRTYGPATPTLLAKLDKAGIRYDFKKTEEDTWSSLVLPLLPAFLLLLILIYLIRQVRGVYAAVSLLMALQKDIQRMASPVGEVVRGTGAIHTTLDSPPGSD